jgi:hypothetical protein
MHKSIIPAVALGLFIWLCWFSYHFHPESVGYDSKVIEQQNALVARALLGENGRKPHGTMTARERAVALLSLYPDESENPQR